MRALRPFFTFYGGKWRAAIHYPAPEHDTIVEPFAGSAGYSLRYPDHKIILVERDPVIAATWRYLLRVGPEEIRAIPNLPESGRVADLKASEEAKLLVSWWLNVCSSGPRVTLSASGCNGPRADSSRYAVFWGPKARERIASQLEKIRHWTVIEGDYSSAPDVVATWFVDPPYQGAGKHYRYGSDRIDYETLAQWCRARCGQAIVCENVGSTWLPFSPFREIKSSEMGHGKHVSREAIWLNGPNHKQIPLLPVQE